MRSARGASEPGAESVHRRVLPVGGRLLHGRQTLPPEPGDWVTPAPRAGPDSPSLDSHPCGPPMCVTRPRGSALHLETQLAGNPLRGTPPSSRAFLVCTVPLHTCHLFLAASACQRRHATSGLWPSGSSACLLAARIPTSCQQDCGLGSWEKCPQGGCGRSPQISEAFGQHPCSGPFHPSWTDSRFVFQIGVARAPPGCCHCRQLGKKSPLCAGRTSL